MRGWDESRLPGFTSTYPQRPGQKGNALNSAQSLLSSWPRDRERRPCWRPSHYNLKWTLNVNWKDWGWSWSSKTLGSWCEELTHWKRPWCWERLKAGGDGDDRGWDGWMASPSRWMWVWASSRRWWRTGKPAVLQSTGSQRIGRDWRTTPHKISLPTSEDTNTFTQELPWKQGGDRCLASLLWKLPALGSEVRCSAPPCWNRS